MADNFSYAADSVVAPARQAVAVTPHDSDALPDIPKALFVGTGGNITMRGVGGATDQVWKNVQGGAILPFRAQYVRAAGTTAGDILALY
jgi:type 1 fimbria pilin